jgi:hypothetical protein
MSDLHSNYRKETKRNDKEEVAQEMNMKRRNKKRDGGQGRAGVKWKCENQHNKLFIIEMRHRNAQLLEPLKVIAVFAQGWRSP